MATAAEPPFHAEIEEVWGRPWGAHDEVGELKVALVRPPGPALDRISADGWDPDLQALVDPDGGWYWTRRSRPTWGGRRISIAGWSRPCATRAARRYTRRRWAIASPRRCTSATRWSPCRAARSSPAWGYTIHLDLHLGMLDLDLALVDTAGLPYAFLTGLERMGVKLVHAHPGEEWG